MKNVKPTYKSRKSVKKYRKVSIKSKPSVSFKKKVLSVVHSNAESKHAFTALTTAQYKGAISNANASFTRLIPNISLGTGDTNRIGDQVRCQSVKWSAIIQMIPQETNQPASSRRIGVRIMVLTPKSFSNWSSASSNFTVWENYILKKGGVVSGFTGDVSDLYAEHNSDAVTLHYNKVFRFTMGSFFQGTSVPANGIVPYEQGNMIRFLRHTFRFKNKLLKYDSNIDGGISPTNIGMVVALGFCYLDGTAMDATARVKFQYISDMSYEDS